MKKIINILVTCILILVAVIIGVTVLVKAPTPRMQEDIPKGIADSEEQPLDCRDMVNFNKCHPDLVKNAKPD